MPDAFKLVTFRLFKTDSNRGLSSKRGFRRRKRSGVGQESSFIRGLGTVTALATCANFPRQLARVDTGLSLLENYKKRRRRTYGRRFKVISCVTFTLEQELIAASRRSRPRTSSRRGSTMQRDRLARAVEITEVQSSGKKIIKRFNPARARGRKGASSIYPFISLPSHKSFQHVHKSLNSLKGVIINSNRVKNKEAKLEFWGPQNKNRNFNGEPKP